MNNTKIDLTLHGDPQTSAAELIIREGIAPPVHEPRIVKLQGTIKAPGDYHDMRNDEFTAEEAHVVANYKERSITLNLDETDHYGPSIKGQLEIHPDLRQFGINDAGRTYDHKKLYKFLKFAGAHFLTKDAHTALLEALIKFEGTAEYAFKDANNFKGSAASQKALEIKTNLHLDFWLAVPLFTGEEKTSFFVDINVDFDAGSCLFWLESVQLNELLVTERDRIFAEQLARLTDYVTIHQY